MDHDVSHYVQQELDALNERVTALEEAKPGHKPEDDVEVEPIDDDVEATPEATEYAQ